MGVIKNKKQYLGKINSLQEQYLQRIIMETEISQSIGRNSGLRHTNKDCVVVLPILNSKSANTIKMPLDLNYVSSEIISALWDGIVGLWKK